MATELKEAKVTVRIATDEALKELDRLDAETRERREAREAEERRRRDDERQRPEKADDARSSDEHDAGPRATNPRTDERERREGGAGRLIGREALARGREFLGGPGEATRRLGAEFAALVPGGRLATQFAEMGSQYGPGVMAAIRPQVPEAARPEFDAMASGVRSAARWIEQAQAKFRSVDTTYEQLKAMAVTQQLWGVPAKWSGLEAAGARLYRVNYAQDMLRRTKDAIAREVGGAAVGNLISDAAREAFGGGAR